MIRDAELVVVKPAEIVVTPMSLIEQASARGASIEQMQQLFDLQLRWEANEAAKAYSVAFAAFKAEGARIVKNADVKAGPLAGSKYADLFGVVNVLVPVLSKHGLSHSWKLTKDEREWLEVTCTLKHVRGHSEFATMGGAPDVGPGRNAIQARSSSNTYLERITFLAVTGYAAAGMDTDGGASADTGIPEGEFVALRDSIEAANTADELKKAFTVAYKRAEVTGDKQAMQSFINAKDTRKKGMAA
jgi:hypothetical protein